MFLDREAELAFLEERYRSGRAELVVVYGRRRVGKTALLRRFLEGKRGAYLLVKYLSAGLVLDDFSASLQRQLSLPYRPRIGGFSELYELLGGLAGDRLVVVIDEFQLLHEADPSSLIQLQACWDEQLRQTALMLVLCGSSVGVVERVGLSQTSPLYGRRTGQLKLQPLSYGGARAFFPGWAEEDRFRAYAVVGGTPAYLERFRPEGGFEENLRREVLERGSYLSQEPPFLLSMETREPLRYASILRALAEGARSHGEVADKAGIPSTDLHKYLRVLIEDLDLVRRVYPLLEEGRRGRARYEISDNFFSFWFGLLYPRLELLEAGEAETLMRAVAPGLELHISRVFEGLCIELLRELARRGRLAYTRAGRWWSGDVEIDAVAIDEERGVAIFCEANYTRERVGREALRRLQDKAREFPWRRGERREMYLLLARAGFSFEGDEDVQLYTLDEIGRLMEAKGPPPMADGDPLGVEAAGVARINA